jgi:CheY-like chemotaxis protein
MRVYVTTLLETNGFQPLSATNGEEGLETARQERPSLIILDIMMPKMGGIRMFHELKKDSNLKEIPVIILSAISEKTFSHSYKRMSRQGDGELDLPAAYIEKPPESDQLLEAIQTSLKRNEGAL